MQGEFDFEKDVLKGESAEKAVLRIIRKKYPKAYKDNIKAWDIVVPEINKTFEVKRDFLVHKTGNYFIETKSGGTPSGLTTTKAWAWILVCDYDGILIPTEWLRELVRDIPEYSYMPKGKDKERTGKLLKRNIVLLDKFAKIIFRKE